MPLRNILLNLTRSWGDSSSLYPRGSELSTLDCELILAMMVSILYH
jgi:hypothetical protein